MRTQRRDFIKLTAAGATGFLLLRPARARAAWPTTGHLAVNPNIDNLRVVACVDAAMLKGTPTTTTFAAENAVVDAARVQANMDAMAMALANAATPDAAWQTIFRSSKPWASTLVAIKINTIEARNMARLAVLQKLCAVLTGFGVPAKNIIIYDGNTTYGGSISNYTSAFSTTDTSKLPGVVSNYSDALGGTTSAPLPDGSSATCTKQIADGTVDILINIANNKGHTLFGGSTLCMKNHFGTFAPPSNANHNNLSFMSNYVFNINKSDAILGGTPVRQQLCFIDSLFANKAQNTGAPEVMPGYLIMGTFAPAVDYLTVKKVREAVMGATHDANTVNSFMTSFGYTTSDPVWVTVPPATGAAPDAGADARTDSLTSATGGGQGSGSGGTNAGGSPGSGGTLAGGNTGAGGASTGGRSSAGGRGGTSGAGGSVSAGGTASGGDSESGGNHGAGGSSSGGTTSSGGTLGAGGAVGSGGSSASTSLAGGSGGLAAGGVSGAGGASPGGAVASTASGCGCHVGRSGRGLGGWGLLLTVGAVAAGQLRRLFVRKEMLSRPDRAEGVAAGSEADPMKE